MVIRIISNRFCPLFDFRLKEDNQCCFWVLSRSMYYAIGNKTQSSGEMSGIEKDYLKKNKPK